MGILHAAGFNPWEKEPASTEGRDRRKDAVVCQSKTGQVLGKTELEDLEKYIHEYIIWESEKCVSRKSRLNIFF